MPAQQHRRGFSAPPARADASARPSGHERGLTPDTTARATAPADRRLARVAQRRRDARDRAEQRQTRRLVARTVAAQQLDLDRVHRIDVRVPQVDRPLHDRLAVEQPLDTRRAQHARDRELVLAFDRRRTSRRATRRRERARGSRARPRGSTSRASSRGCRRPCGRTAAPRTGGGARRAAASRSAVPQPNHAGSSTRFCVHAKTHGIARSEAR